MSYAPGAPELVWAMKIDPGAKWTIAACWSKADHDVQQNPRPTTIWFPAREFPEGHEKAGKRMPAALSRDTAVSEKTGATIDAIKKHWAKLRRLGLATVSGRCIDLHTPAEHFGDHSPRAEDHSPPAGEPRPRTTVPKTGTTVPGPGTSVPKTGTTVPSNQYPPVPPIPPSPGVEDATPPTPSESTSHDEVTRGPDPAPGNSQRGHARASLPAHTREVLDRASASSRGGTDEKSKRPGPGRHSLSERIAAVNDAAGYHASGAASPGWVPDMRKFQRDTGVSDVELVAMFEAWQLAPRPKPAMDKIWWPARKAGGREWLDTHFGLGKAAPPPLTDAPNAEIDAFWAQAHAKAANS